jgi:hypothetical protein
MKKFIVSLAVLTSFSSLAASISITKSNTLNVVRIDKVITLVEKSDIKAFSILGGAQTYLQRKISFSPFIPRAKCSALTQHLT